MDTLKTLPILALLSLAACDRRHSNDPAPVIERPRVEQPKSYELGTGGGPIEMSGAVDKIADARCDREIKCGNVADGKKWSDRAACTSAIQKSLADELNADDCPAGIDVKELDECLHSARNEDCKNPLDKLGRIAACRTSDLCRH